MSQTTFLKKMWCQKCHLKQPENTTALYPTYDESLESENDGLEDELARQFAHKSKRVCKKWKYEQKLQMLKMHWKWS